MRTLKMLNRIGLVVAAVCLIAIPAISTAQKSDGVDAKANRQEEKRLGRIWRTQVPVEGFESVELFAAMNEGTVEVVIKAKDSTEANIIVTNKSDKPLAIQMPPAFAAVPVMAQFGGGQGGGGFGGGGGGQGGGGMGMGGGQGVGGGFGGGGGMGGGGMGGGMGGGGGGFGGGGGGGGAPPQGGIFNIPPGRVGKVNISIFCLEHGKTDPRPQIEYTIKPLSVLSSDPMVEKFCHLLASGQIDQHVAQASAWSVANGLTWEFMLTKNRVERMDGTYERYFTPNQLLAAQHVVTWAKQQVEADKIDSKNKPTDRYFGSQTGHGGK